MLRAKRRLSMIAIIITTTALSLTGGAVVSHGSAPMACLPGLGAICGHHPPICVVQHRCF